MSRVDHWTKARFFSFIRSALRRASGKYPNKFEALKLAKRNKPKGVEGRHRFEYLCAECGEYFQQKEVSVDHIIPCGTLQSFEDISPFCERLFCSVEGFQILCGDKSVKGKQSCHSIKTRGERGISEVDYKVNQFAKLKLDKQKATLLKYGYEGAEVSNLTKRKMVYRTLIEEEKING